jgi:Protein of unknown function (DUF3047)
MKSWKATLAATAIALLAGCGSAPPAPPPLAGVQQGAWAERSSAEPAAGSRWQHYKLPGKAATLFESTRTDGRDAVAAQAVSSASMLRRKLRIEGSELGEVRFSWKVPELIADADMASRDADDSPVRVILAFEGDRREFSAKNSMLSELALAVTGEQMPYATLMYVWCNKRAQGTVVASPRTDRIRTIVVESGPNRLGQWLGYKRDIRADFERAFGEAPGALVGVAIMTDSDNTKSTARAWYGPVHVAPKLALHR